MFRSKTSRKTTHIAFNHYFAFITTHQNRQLVCIFLLAVLFLLIGSLDFPKLDNLRSTQILPLCLRLFIDVKMETLVCIFLLFCVLILLFRSFPSRNPCFSAPDQLSFHSAPTCLSLSITV